MTVKPRSEYEFRCNCKHRPLLAVYGREGGTGLLYVHIRVYKAGKLYAEVYSNHDVRLICRECQRWHRIFIRSNTQPKMIPERAPKDITPHNPRPQSLRTPRTAP